MRKISEQSIAERVTTFSWVLFFSITSIVLSFILVNEQLKSEKEKIKNENIAKEQIRIATQLAFEVYALRSRIDDVAHYIVNPNGRSPDSLKNELDLINIELSSKTTKLREKIESANNVYEELSQKDSIGISLISSAYAADGKDQSPADAPKNVIYVVLFVFTLIVVLLFYVLLTSKDERRIEFAEKHLNMSIGVIVGAMGGGFVVKG